MHHIYHTEALILGSQNYREADKYYYLFTKDLGMLTASAQGVRKLSSKLRFVLQDYQYIKLDLIKGKDFWRITNASKTNQLDQILKEKEKSIIVFNIFRLLKRLLTGQEVNSELFEEVLAGFLILEKSKDLILSKNLELVLVLKILNNLGYLSQENYLDNLVSFPFNQINFENEINRRKISILINKILKESQL